MDAITIKQLNDTKQALQQALDAGDDDAADSLMLRCKSLQETADASTHVTTTASPATTRTAAKVPPASERAMPLWRALTVRVVAAIEQRALVEVAAARYGDLSRKAADELDFIVKAAQGPAMTGVTGWAAELTQQVQAAYLAELAKVSVFASLPLVDESFNGATSITVPTRDTTASTPNLAATWRKEGDPIRVGAIKLRGVRLTPYCPAILGSFSQELAKRSTPRIESVIREAVLADSATAFDTKFLSADAAVVDVSPAGIMSGQPASNTYASTGATPAAVVADLKKAAALLLKAGLSADGFAWAMSPFNAMALQLLITATGTLQFPEMQNGRLLGLPVVVSANVPDTDVYLIDGASVARALPVPTFDVSTEATIHEEGTTPMPISTPGTPATVAAPTRSLYQTYSAALRAVYADLSWGALRPGASVHITGVSW